MLPVKFRIIFKIILTTFKALHALSPLYLSSLLALKEQLTYDLQSDDTKMSARPTIKFARTTGYRDFLVLHMYTIFIFYTLCRAGYKFDHSP